MLKAALCRLTGKHCWGETRTEMTGTGRHIYHICLRCYAMQTVADIRTLDAAWPTHRASRAV